MTKQKNSLFIPLKKFQKYSINERIDFMEKMKEYRLMRHQSVAWGYGPNYLSQMYSKMMPERENKEFQDATEKKKQAEIKRLAEGLPVIKKNVVKEKEIEKAPEVVIEEVVAEAEEKVVRPFEGLGEKESKKIRKERAKIEVQDVDQETAMALLAELTNHFSGDLTESVLKKSASGFSISFKALQEEVEEEGVRKRA